MASTTTHPTSKTTKQNFTNSTPSASRPPDNYNKIHKQHKPGGLLRNRTRSKNSNPLKKQIINNATSVARPQPLFGFMSCLQREISDACQQRMRNATSDYASRARFGNAKWLLAVCIPTLQSCSGCELLPPSKFRAVFDTSDAASAEQHRIVRLKFWRLDLATYTMRRVASNALARERFDFS